MESNKSIHRSDEQKNLYKALVEAYESDKLILDTYGDTVSFKRRRDDEDKDEEPSAGSNRGSKRRRAGKEPESTSAPKEKTSKTPGKSTDGSKSQHKSAGEYAHTEEPMHTDKDLEEPAHQEFDIGATEEQSDVETSLHLDCNLAWEEGPRESFDELMDTPLDFSAFMMNRLKIDTSTPELLAESQYFDLIKDDDKASLTNLNVEDRLAFGVSLRMFTRSIVIQMRVEDLQLGIKSHQKNLNITKPDTYRSDLKRRDAYTAYSNPRGFIYQNKDKKNKLMRIDELNKFSDGTLDDVRTALNDRLKGIRIEYLPKTIWRQSDRERAKAMIQAIDKQLKSRRIMRSLEKFVGGRPYEVTCTGSKDQNDVTYDVPSKSGQTIMPPKSAPLTQAANLRMIKESVDAAIAAEQARHVNAVNDARGSRPARGQDVAPVVCECTFARFMKCNPTAFHGTEGAVELRRWFEKTESVFKISECAEGKKVKYVVAMLQGPALTWWNVKVATTGLETVNQMPRTKMKQLMTAEFCLIEEVQRMEHEL
ncbi:hypothetical protein Tco_1019725 [Tanacetum coccineum]|uniref:Reverse transcriptase domain-containing protein n=1 Tax=Tanacetum coccineum TaxID=301880 RepID=A0ABQ5FY77_9ASTR